jgi:hypothetical protein
MGTGPSFCHQFNTPGINTITCSYTSTDGRSFQTDQLVHITTKAKPTFFIHSFAIVFGALFSAGIAGGSLFYLKKNKKRVPQDSLSSAQNQVKRKNESVSYEDISKKIDEVLKR